MRDDPKTFVEHLSELRKRIIISAFATAAGTIASFIFRDRLFDFKNGLLIIPFRRRPSDILATFFGTLSRARVGSSVLDLLQLFFRSRTSQAGTITLVSITPLEKFMVVFKASFAVGVLLAVGV